MIAKMHVGQMILSACAKMRDKSVGNALIVIIFFLQ